MRQKARLARSPGVCRWFGGRGELRLLKTIEPGVSRWFDEVPRACPRGCFRGAAHGVADGSYSVKKSCRFSSSDISSRKPRCPEI